MLNRRLSSPRAALVVGVAAALAAVVAVNPSFAGSFLTSQKAAHLFLTNKKASNLYVSKKSAGLFLKKKAAGNLYVGKAEAPLTPIVGIAAGTAVFGPVSATTAGYIPTAFTSFATKEVAPAVITFSGSAICTADKPAAELACPIQILVDGQSTGKVNFAPATPSSEAAKAAALVHTVTQTTVLSKGGHTVAVQYAGAAKVTFTLKGWNLAVQAYPERPETPTTDSEVAGGKKK